MVKIILEIEIINININNKGIYNNNKPKIQKIIKLKNKI